MNILQGDQSKAIYNEKENTQIQDNERSFVTQANA